MLNLSYFDFNFKEKEEMKLGFQTKPTSSV